MIVFCLGSVVLFGVRCFGSVVWGLTCCCCFSSKHVGSWAADIANPVNEAVPAPKKKRVTQFERHHGFQIGFQNIYRGVHSKYLKSGMLKNPVYV